jgi:hypothetical protein
VLGVEPVSAGWKKLRIAPQVGSLKHAKGMVPTPLGPVQVSWKITDLSFELECTIPEGSQATVRLPYATARVTLDGKSTQCRIENDHGVLDLSGAGEHRLVMPFKN